MFATRHLLLLGLGGLAAEAAAQTSPPDPQAIARALKDNTAEAPDRCTSKDPAVVVVCGRSGERYRIDPVVLQATRDAEGLPAKPPLGDAEPDNDCIGPQHCGGGTIPLVNMALAGLKAAELAANGDDWREAFRTHPDQYQLYQDAKARAARRPHISFEVSAGSK
jgi:hypothetical protein